MQVLKNYFLHVTCSLVPSPRFRFQAPRNRFWNKSGGGAGDRLYLQDLIAHALMPSDQRLSTCVCIPVTYKNQRVACVKPDNHQVS